MSVWIATGYFLFEKQAFIGLLKVIGIQNKFWCNLSCNHKVCMSMIIIFKEVNIWYPQF